LRQQTQLHRQFVQVLKLELVEWILIEEFQQEVHSAVEGEENAIVFELNVVHFEEAEQVKPLQIDPHSEGPDHLARLPLNQELDVSLELLGSECFVEELEHLQCAPAPLVPLAFSFELVGHLGLEGWEVLVADDVDQVSECTNPYLEKSI
jgi:hypothetical protein